MEHLGRLHALLLTVGVLIPDGRAITVQEAIVARAVAYDGVREVGENWGPDVSCFLANVSIHVPAAWCGGYAYTLRKESMGEPPGDPKRYAWVPSWLTSGNTVWLRSSGQRPDPGTVQVGDVVLLWYVKLKRHGHIGTVIEVRKDGVVASEGNTNQAGSRQGQGVYQHFRSFDIIHTIVRPALPT